MLTKLKFDYKIINHFKDKGWHYTHDNLGLYFEKHGVKVSVMYEGPCFGCYKNQLINGKWTLLKKQSGFLTDKFAYAWMLANMQ